MPQKSNDFEVAVHQWGCLSLNLLGQKVFTIWCDWCDVLIRIAAAAFFTGVLINYLISYCVVVCTTFFWPAFASQCYRWDNSLGWTIYLRQAPRHMHIFICLLSTSQMVHNFMAIAHLNMFYISLRVYHRISVIINKILSILRFEMLYYSIMGRIINSIKHVLCMFYVCMLHVCMSGLESLWVPFPVFVIL